MQMDKSKDTQDTTVDVTKEIRKQKRNPTRKINHWWTKRPDSQRMVKDQRIHQLLLKAKLPTFTEGRNKINIMALSFTDDELPMFTEGREKEII